MPSFLEALAGHRADSTLVNSPLDGLIANAQQYQSNNELRKLAALGGPYAAAYANALTRQADPTYGADEQLNRQLKLAQLNDIQNPYADPAKRLQLESAQIELQQNQAKLQQLQQLEEQNNAVRRQLNGGVTIPTIGPTSQNDALPLNARNNNPGNLKDPATGEFRRFSDPQQGYLANLADLQLKLAGNSPVMAAKFGKDYTPTLDNVIQTWAPASDNNDPKAYAAYVSRETGIPTDKPLTKADAATILPAMAKFEGAPIPSTVTVSQPMTNAMTLPNEQGPPVFSLSPETLNAQNVLKQFPGNEIAQKSYKELYDRDREAYKDALELYKIEKPSASDKKIMREEAVAAKKAEAGQESEKIKAQDVYDAVGNSLKLIDKPLTGGYFGKALEDTGGTNAFDLNTQLDTIRANLSFDRLQEMRQNSPTGAAVGNVSDSDLRLLAATAGSLKLGQSDEQLKATLNKIQTRYADILKKLGVDPQQGEKSANSTAMDGFSIKKID